MCCLECLAVTLARRLGTRLDDMAGGTVLRPSFIETSSIPSSRDARAVAASAMQSLTAGRKSNAPYRTIV